MTNPENYLRPPPGGLSVIDGSEIEGAIAALNKKESGLEEKGPIGSVHAVLQCTFDRFWVPLTERKYLNIDNVPDEEKRKALKKALKKDGIYISMANWGETDGIIKNDIPFWRDFREEHGLQGKSSRDLVLRWAEEEGRFPTDPKLRKLFDQIGKEERGWYPAQLERALYANRTSEEVLEHGFLSGSGCTDMSTVGATLLRKCRVPVGVVFGITGNSLLDIAKRYEKRGEEETARRLYKDVRSHAFFVIYDNGDGKWKIFDPKWTKNPGFENFYASEGRPANGLGGFSHGGKEGMIYIPFAKSGEYDPETAYHSEDILFSDAGDVQFARPGTLGDFQPLIRFAKSYAKSQIRA